MTAVDIDAETYKLFAKGQPGIAKDDVPAALRTLFKNPTKAEINAFPAGPVDAAKLKALPVAKSTSADEVGSAFQVFDKLANGQVSSNEVRGELTRLSDDGLVELSDEDIDEIMAKLDAEKTGTIAYDEFVALAMSVEKFPGLPPLNPDDVLI